MRLRKDVVSAFEQRRNAAEAVLEECTGVKAARDELLNDRRKLTGGTASRARYGSTESRLERQEREMREQDGHIDSVAATVRNTKEIAATIHREVC